MDFSFRLYHYTTILYKLFVMAVTHRTKITERRNKISVNNFPTVCTYRAGFIFKSDVPWATFVHLDKELESVISGLFIVQKILWVEVLWDSQVSKNAYIHTLEWFLWLYKIKCLLYCDLRRKNTINSQCTGRTAPIVPSNVSSCTTLHNPRAYGQLENVLIFSTDAKN